jgi:hypothetical protein
LGVRGGPRALLRIREDTVPPTAAVWHCNFVNSREKIFAHVVPPLSRTNTDLRTHGEPATQAWLAATSSNDRYTTILFSHADRAIFVLQFFFLKACTSFLSHHHTPCHTSVASNFTFLRFFFIIITTVRVLSNELLLSSVDRPPKFSLWWSVTRSSDNNSVVHN